MNNMHSMIVLGLDVGGANIKAAVVKSKQALKKELKTSIQYFPIWIKGKEALTSALHETVSKLIEGEKMDAAGVTMTAELSDVYYTKREGVNHVLDCVQKVFPQTPTFVLNVDGALISVDEARKQPYTVASANWAATGWLVSQFMKNCIIMDTGSTTTSIIPIVNGRVAVGGKTDLEKLSNGELVYTGALRTNVAAVVQVIPVKGRLVKVSSEFFASTGDVHIILGHLTEKEHTVDTADGRGKNIEACMARLARAVCADMEMLKEEEIVEMAEYVAGKQVENIVEALKQVLGRGEFTNTGRKNLSTVVTGLGKKFLAAKAAEKIGLKCIDLDELIDVEASKLTPALALALMVAYRYD